MFKKTRVCKGLMLAFGGSLALGGMPALAQQQASQLDRVEVTGSSIKRIESEGALAVQTITRVEIDRLGVQSTEQLLQTISAMSSSGNIQNSTGVGLGTSGAAGVSLRGLGDERTLVLLNGRRLVAFAGGGGASVNINNIPLAAIERVEVLKDGASSVYGSDAVAGVVNFILVKNFEGIQVGGTYGQPTASGGGEQYQFNVVGGIGDLNKDRYNLTGSFQYQKDSALFGKDREFARNGVNPPLFVNGATGQGNIQGGWVLGTGRVPGYSAAGTGGGFGNPLAALGQCGDIKMFGAGATSQGGQYCAYDSAPDVGLIPDVETTSGTLNFVYKINDKAEFFADGIYSRSKITQTYQPSPARTSFFETDDLFAQNGIDPVLLLRTSNPNYKIASDYLANSGVPALQALVGQDLGITARVFDFGPRSNTDTSTQSRLVGGVRGELFGQDYTVAGAYNKSELESQVNTGYFSQVKYAEALQNPASDWNPWSSTQSPAFQSLIAPSAFSGKTLTAESTSWAFDGTVSGPVATLPAGEMQYAVGYAYRNESLKINPGPELLSGDISGLGGAQKPLDKDRSINSVFGELNIPVIKNLDLNLSARYDNYSDVGSSTNWKGNVRWQPVQEVLVRGGYGTGFRAPTLNDLYYPQVLGTSAQFTDPVTGQSDLQVNELSGGNPDLKPEDSKQWSLGIVLQPMSSLSFGVDYFNINIENVISQPSTQEIVSQNAMGNAAYAGLVLRDPVSGEIISTKATLANTGTLEAEGLDISANFRQVMGPGRLDINLQGTYYIKYDQSTPGAGTSHKVGTIVDGTGAPLISSLAGVEGVGVVLRYKQYLSGTWTQGAWATTLGSQYATGYYAGWDLNDTPTHIGSMTLWDLQVAWSGVKNLTLSAGARNLFDKQPSFYVPVSNQFQVGYDPSQYDPRARFVYLTATYKFF